MHYQTIGLMAWKLSLALCFALVSFCKSQTFPFVERVTCQQDQFFNSANQQCQSCANYINGSQATTDRLECICQPNFKTNLTFSANHYLTCIACSNFNIDCSTSSSNCAANEVFIEMYTNNAFLLTGDCATCSALSSPSSQSIVCDYIAPTVQGTVTADANDLPYVQQELPSAQAGCQYTTSPNVTACQVLANLCVLQFYGGSASACSEYVTIFSSRSSLNNIATWVENLPMIYYTSVPGTNIAIDPGDLVTSLAITAPFSFRDGNTILDIVVMKYHFNGTFLGAESATSGALQICPDKPSVSVGAFIFGTAFQQSCSLSALELRDQSKYPPVMYDLNLRFVDASGSSVLFPIPVLVSTFPGPYVRRFSLVDSFSMADDQIIRYPSSFSLRVNLGINDDGTITPPVVSIIYSSVSTTSPTPVDISFTIDYFMPVDIEAFQITLPIFGLLGLIYAFLLTSSWRRRQGLQVIDGSSVVMFLYFSLAMVANAFFIVMCGYAVITMMFYKSQTVVTTIPPNEQQRGFFVVFTSLAFAFKAFEILGMIFFQSTADIFLIDWEKPKIEAEGKVSIWRTFFIANEWNEIQTFRKINFPFQLLTVLLFLEVIGFKSLAIENSNSNLNQVTTNSADAPPPIYNPVLRFGIASAVCGIVALVQVIYRVLIHERFIHDKIREFVDLCSVSNVSVFILANRQYGYYIHGRSVHGKADTDMLDMNIMLKKEEENLTPGRGLESGTELQTFAIATSSHFRSQYDKIYQPLQAVRHQPTARGGNLGADSEVTESVRAYSMMRDFLTSFIDHSLRDLDYVVKNKLLLENLCETEFEEPLASTCYFYNDPGNSFTENLFYGREFTLQVFDILLFAIIDYHIFNYLLAAIITFIVHKFLVFLRQEFGRRNLAKKTLVDKRFLI